MTVKSRLLELLEQHRGETLSGEELARELSCTRAAVWKAVKTLREEGYHIDAGTNRGYVLSPDSHRLSLEAIRLHLREPQVYMRLYQQISSTNQEAKKAAIQREAGHGAFVLALEQTEGRGRRGRSFYSPRGGGLYLSVVLEPKDTIQSSLLLTTGAAAAVCMAVEEVCGVSLDIKWVNDLYKDGKKVCGILTEAVTDFESGSIEFAIVGIGLNLYLEEKALPEELKGLAGSVYASGEEAGRADLNRLAAGIVNHLLEETRRKALSPEYVRRSILPGRDILVMDKERVRPAKALELCPDGRLLIQEEDGSRRQLSYEEVSVRMRADGARDAGGKEKR
ncbi:MAG: biotin--[acetyl-CoA-carboxylase] ligase [Eubacteriales bacterium]|nr:biotin--[acetyl-CoA-carboxylase] ligase [Eubacteriales bacterium]